MKNNHFFINKVCFLLFAAAYLFISPCLFGGQPKTVTKIIVGEGDVSCFDISEDLGAALKTGEIFYGVLIKRLKDDIANVDIRKDIVRCYILEQLRRDPKLTKDARVLLLKNYRKEEKTQWDIVDVGSSVKAGNQYANGTVSEASADDMAQMLAAPPASSPPGSPVIVVPPTDDGKKPDKPFPEPYIPPTPTPTPTPPTPPTPSSDLAITTTSPLTNGYEGYAYSQTFSASGGTTPYTWSLASGSLPSGLSLSSAGVLSGTVASSGAQGTYTFTIGVTDGSGSATKEFSLVVQYGSPVFNTTNITNGSTNCSYPKINAGQITWFSEIGAVNREIFFWNGSSISQITSTGTNNWNPQIYDGKLTWYGYDGSDYEIYYWDGSSVSQITSNAYDDYDPQIYNGKITWRGQSSTWQIYYWDGASTVNVSSNADNNYKPKIYANTVAWQRVNVESTEIYYWDGVTTTRITTNVFEDTDPEVYAGKVVWSGYDGNDYEIYLWDSTTGTTTQLTNNTTDDGLPKIYANKVVWQGYDGANTQIFYWNGSSTIQVTSGGYDSFYPQIYNTKLTWQGYDGSDYEIFYWDGVTVAQVTSNSTDDYYPQIFDNKITWQGYSGSYWDIYVAERSSGSDPSITGRVYDSSTGETIKGAVVSIYPKNSTTALATCNENPYSFNVSDGYYYIRAEKEGYTFPSNTKDGVISGDHGEVFYASGSAMDMDLPLDQGYPLEITKTSNKKTVVNGDIITFDIKIRNNCMWDISSVNIIDEITNGFKYVKDSTYQSNAKFADTNIDFTNRKAIFKMSNIPGHKVTHITYQVRVGTGISAGEYKTKAVAWDRIRDWQMSNQTSCVVDVIADALFTMGTIIGKAFYDKNGDGVQQNGEKGIPDVVIASEYGVVVQTDCDGKYHIADVPPGTHLLKVNSSSLPKGSEYEFSTENPYLVKITEGLLAKVDFGVTQIGADAEALINTDIKNEVPKSITNNTKPAEPKKSEVLAKPSKEAPKPAANNIKPRQIQKKPIKSEVPKPAINNTKPAESKKAPALAKPMNATPTKLATNNIKPRQIQKKPIKSEVPKPVINTTKPVEVKKAPALVKAMNATPTKPTTNNIKPRQIQKKPIKSEVSKPVINTTKPVEPKKVPALAKAVKAGPKPAAKNIKPRQIQKKPIKAEVPKPVINNTKPVEPIKAPAVAKPSKEAPKPATNNIKPRQIQKKPIKSEVPKPVINTTKPVESKKVPALAKAVKAGPKPAAKNIKPRQIQKKPIKSEVPKSVTTNIKPTESKKAPALAKPKNAAPTKLVTNNIKPRQIQKKPIKSEVSKPAINTTKAVEVKKAPAVAKPSKEAPKPAANNIKPRQIQKKPIKSEVSKPVINNTKPAESIKEPVLVKAMNATPTKLATNNIKPRQIQKKPIKAEVPKPVINNTKPAESIKEPVLVKAMNATPTKPTTNNIKPRQIQKKPIKAEVPKPAINTTKPVEPIKAPAVAKPSKEAPKPAANNIKPRQIQKKPIKSEVSKPVINTTKPVEVKKAPALVKAMNATPTKLVTNNIKPRQIQKKPIKSEVSKPAINTTKAVEVKKAPAVAKPSKEAPKPAANNIKPRQIQKKPIKSEVSKPAINNTKPAESIKEPVLVKAMNATPTKPTTNNIKPRQIQKKPIKAEVPKPAINTTKPVESKKVPALAKAVKAGPKPAAKNIKPRQIQKKPIKAEVPKPVVNNTKPVEPIKAPAVAKPSKEAPKPAANNIKPRQIQKKPIKAEVPKPVINNTKPAESIKEPVLVKAMNATPTKLATNNIKPRQIQKKPIKSEVSKPAINTTKAVEVKKVPAVAKPKNAAPTKPTTNNIKPRQIQKKPIKSEVSKPVINNTKPTEPKKSVVVAKPSKEAPKPAANNIKPRQIQKKPIKAEIPKLVVNNIKPVEAKKGAAVAKPRQNTNVQIRTKDNAQSGTSYLLSTPKPKSNIRQDIKEFLDQFFIVALGEGIVRNVNTSGNIEMVEQDDRFDEGFNVEGKLALYLTGKIKGKYLVTASLDTDRRPSRGGKMYQLHKLFTNLDPDKYYPVYGDASKVDYSANDTQDELYLLVEWDQSSAKWGSFNTDIPLYNRSLQGAHIAYQSVKKTKFDDPYTTINAFYAKANQVAAHDEFLGTGGSLYYLRRTPVIEGSEKMRVELRDQVNKQALATVMLTEEKDYEITYDNGTIILKKPLTSINYSYNATIISNDILAGARAYLIVDYEYESNSTMRKDAYGIKASQQLGDHVRVGGTYVDEEKDLKNYKLMGGDGSVKLNKDTEITAEYDRSEQTQLTGAYSIDGGLNSSVVGSDDDDDKSGSSVTVKGKTKLFDNTDIDLGFTRQDPHFSSTTSLSTQGTVVYTADILSQLKENLSVGVKHVSQEVKDAVLAEDLIGNNMVHTTTGMIDYRPDPWDIRLEYQHQAVHDPYIDYSYQGFRQTMDDDFLGGRVGYKFNEKLHVYTGGQATLSGYVNNQGYVGAECRVWDKTNLNIKETAGNLGNSTLLGITTQVTPETEAYSNIEIGNNSQLGGDGDFTKTTVGQKVQIDKNSALNWEKDYSSWQSNVLQGDLVGYDTKLSDTLAMGISYERAEIEKEPTAISRDSGSIALTYLNIDTLKAFTKLEARQDRGETKSFQWLTQNNILYQFNKDISVLGRANWSNTNNQTTDETEAEFHEMGVGMAYRPVAFDKLNLLAKYSYITNLMPYNQDDFIDAQEDIRNIYAIEGVYDICKYMQIVGKFAMRDMSEKVGPRDWTDSETYLYIGRLNFHVTSAWDIAAEYRNLANRQIEDSKKGWLFEVDREINKYVRFGVGYNFTDYDDDLSNSDNYDAGGWFVRVNGKY